MGFIDKEEIIGRKIIEQARRGISRLAHAEVARIVLDAFAGAHFLDHLQIIVCALLNPLQFQVISFPPRKNGIRLLKLGLDRLNSMQAHFFRRDVVGAWIDRNRVECVSMTFPVKGSISLIRSISSPNNSIRMARSSS